MVYHDRSGRSLTYGALVAAVRRQRPPVDVVLKQPSDFRVIGKPLKRVDTPEKVDGSAKFGIDVVVEGMRYAAIVMCPTIGGTVKSVDDRAARSSPGVSDAYAQ